MTLPFFICCIPNDTDLVCTTAGYTRPISLPVYTTTWYTSSDMDLVYTATGYVSNNIDLGCTTIRNINFTALGTGGVERFCCPGCFAVNLEDSR